MTVRARVIALGQRAAGDDGVGPAILEELRCRDVPAGVELIPAEDAMGLVSLLETPGIVVLVDAVVGAIPGEVLSLPATDFATRAIRSVSSHGIDAGAVIELVRLLAPASIAPAIFAVGVTIAFPDRFRVGLSPGVAAAVPCAADRVLDLVVGASSPSFDPRAGSW